MSPLLDRREVLRVGALSALGFGLADALRWRRLAAAAPARRAAKACILVWLDGGPSHLDMFDPKPEAPKEVRGPFGAIPSRIPGALFSELLPELAARADRLAVLRSLTSPLGEHNLGAHYVLTGYRPTPALEYPSIGALRSRKAEALGELPPFVSLGDQPNNHLGAGYLPRQHGPFVVDGDPSRPEFRVRDVELHPRLSAARLARRERYLGLAEALARRADAGPPASARLRPEDEQAFRLLTSPAAREAFALHQETAAQRARYGGRTLGQSLLLARRLVERGVPFVTVTDAGWDTHQDAFRVLKEGFTGGRVGKVPIFDQALAALIDDLAERGLLEETLVLVLGEFGRTPKVNTSGGRDHWPRVFSAVLAGGGVRGGQVIGRSDALGESPEDRAVTPADLARSVLLRLGLDPDEELRTADGRPVRANAGGEAIAELVG